MLCRTVIFISGSDCVTNIQGVGKNGLLRRGLGLERERERKERKKEKRKKRERKKQQEVGENVIRSVTL